jgi:hypothetical protein
MEEEPDTRFVTLECGHIFTVETLDGSVDIAEYYECDAEGLPLAAKNPSPGYKKRPMCPYCRTPIRSKRHNRIIKRALIDILEQHAITRAGAVMQYQRRQVNAIQLSIIGIENNLSASVRSLSFGGEQEKNVRLSKWHAINGAMRYNGTRFESIHPAFFDGRLKDLFVIDGPIARVWRQAIKPLMDAYVKLDQLFSTESSPHVRILQSTVNKLTAQHQEAMVLANGGGQVTQQMAAGSQAIAVKRIGVPFPRGEKRFKLEALQLAIRMRLQLARLSKRVADELVKGAPRPDADNGRTRQAIVDRFHVLTWTLLISCVRDADLCHDMCAQAAARRLHLQTVLIWLRSRFDLSHYVAERAIRSATQPMLKRDSAAKQMMAERDEVLPAAANKIAQSRLPRQGSRKSFAALDKQYYPTRMAGITRAVGPGCRSSTQRSLLYARQRSGKGGYRESGGRR